jgi:predicted dehydrogenase
MRIALVGLGNAGFDIHLPALAGLPSTTIVGLCDVDETRRARASALSGAPAFAGFDEMLSQSRPDVVIVGTPPDSHADYCIRALGAGAHVLCEKPFTSSLQEADAVIDAAARANRRVALNHEFREMPILRALSDTLKAGGPGSLTFLQLWQLYNLPSDAETNWRDRLVQRSLFEAGVHLVDFAMALFGEVPVSVQASTYGDRRPATDAIVLVTFEFSGGRLAQITQNRLCRGETQYFEVRADTANASYRASFGGRARVSAGLFRSTTPHLRVEFGRSGIAWKETGSRRSLLARNPKDPTVAATRTVFQKTFDGFATGAAVPTSAELGRDILRVTVACYHSAVTGRRLRLDDPVLRDLTTLKLGA